MQVYRVEPVLSPEFHLGQDHKHIQEVKFTFWPPDPLNWDSIIVSTIRRRNFRGENWCLLEEKLGEYPRRKYFKIASKLNFLFQETVKTKINH